MTVLLVMLVSIGFLFGFGWIYSRFVTRRLGQDPSYVTPAVARNDGRDYVPTPTTVVFAHHFAAIAGAGPIVGPVIAIIYGWVPAILWVVLGGVLIGGVHDYLATYIATREGGMSVATIVRRLIGKGPFVAITVFLVVMLALVCAAFLNLSAKALTSMVPFDRLDLQVNQTTFRVRPGEAEACGEPIGGTIQRGGKMLSVQRDPADAKVALYQDGQTVVSKADIIETKRQAGGEVIVSKRPLKVVIGGIASMSVIAITLMAPLIGWMYIRRQVAVWKCSLLAVAICAASIVVGIFLPISFQEMDWKLLLSVYVLIAAGVPVWILLQSRDFINVHILYAGTAALLVTLVVAALRGSGSPDPIPEWNIEQGEKAMGLFWPCLFITIACGAVSGFHSLCAGGTTCKQLRTERSTRTVGFWAMILESSLAVAVIGVLMIGLVKADYIADVHAPKLLSFVAVEYSNPVLAFAVAVGNATHLAWGVPGAWGALAGMILLEGFLVTTLDAAIRLTRYLLEEIWQTLLGRYDVFAAGAGLAAGAPGGPASAAVPTRGLLRQALLMLRHYWVNSGLAVGLMLAFALTGGVTALWKIFATSNQLLAAMVLAIASLWLLRRGRKFWFALVPAACMLATTAASLILLLKGFLAAPGKNATLLVADVLIMAITVYLLIAGIAEAVRVVRRGRGGGDGQTPAVPEMAKSQA